MHFQKPMLGVPPDWSNPLNKGCVMHLAMNEGHGSIVRDLSMYGNHGTLQNVAFPSTPVSGWNPGQTGVGVNFDGTNDYVNCGNGGSLNTVDAATVSMWVNPAQLNYANHCGIMGKSEYEVGGYMIGIISGGGDLKFYTNDLGNAYSLAVPQSNLTVGEWSMLALTVDDTSTLHAYIDGVEVGTPIAAGLKTTANSLYVGDSSQGGWDQHFNGGIDQIRIHNRALTAKEVRDYYINPWQVYLDEDDM